MLMQTRMILSWSANVACCLAFLNGCSCKQCFKQNVSNDLIPNNLKHEVIDYAQGQTKSPYNQMFTPTSDFTLEGLDLYLEAVPNSTTVGVIVSEDPAGISVKARTKEYSVGNDGQYWYHFHLTSDLPLTKGTPYYLVPYETGGATYACYWYSDSQNFLYRTYSSDQERCPSSGGLVVGGNYPTNTAVAWTTLDDITGPGPHAFTMSYISREGFVGGVSNVTFVTVPADVPVSAGLTLENLVVSNAPAGNLLYGVIGGAGGMGSLYATNFPQFSNMVLLQMTTGSNVATIVPGKSWISIQGTNGVVPLSGELVWMVTNALYQGTNGLVTVDVAGTYDFGLREADWTVANWSCQVPTIPPMVALPAIAGGVFSFLLQTVGQQTYAVQSTSPLASTNWQLVTNIVGDGSVYRVRDPIAGAPQKFYRVSSP